MKIASVLENQKIEKRIAITPEIAKKYISLDFEVYLPENYGSHLGIKDEDYKESGASILKDEKEIITSADIIIQLGLLDDDKNSLLKENIALVTGAGKVLGKARVIYFAEAGANLIILSRTKADIIKVDKKIIKLN